MDRLDLYTLLLREHYDQITDQERIELEAILAEDPEAQEMQKQIKKSVPEDQAKEMMGKINVEESLLLVKQRNKVYQRKVKIRRWAAAAVFIPILVVGGYFAFKNNTQSSVNKLAQNNELTLQLANGQQILLQDTGTQKIVAGDAQLNNQNRVLRIDNKDYPGGWNTLKVPPKLDYKVILADGSEVWLNSVSSIRFPLKFTDEKREVYIDGEAYFNIAPDPDKPFIVHSKGTEIRVLGTEFNVNTYKTGTTVTSLVKGKVAVENAGKLYELVPGKEARINESAGTATVQDFHPFTTLSWRQGVYFFEDESLSEIAEMINRCYNEQVIMDNPAISKLLLRGKFNRHQPVENLMEILNNTGRVTLYRKDGAIHCK
ncbi:FecR family protein [Chitinophaga niabensis]|uniref:FecR protein n=1 Tax=Chitinophaga niabensis TaxID=536979 RepID=A0A1N6KAE7_9BACT|nr:FecR domain-containing protein [Chitinophaga niabensis]SIO53574.1 protein of unknown function [Chitinophaga niabensis]